jgi:YVTN family beta-propeller protein
MEVGSDEEAVPARVAAVARAPHPSLEKINEARQRPASLSEDSSFKVRTSNLGWSRASLSKNPWRPNSFASWNVFLPAFNLHNQSKKCSKLAGVHILRIACPAALLALVLLPLGCHRGQFPDVPAGYREFAYVSNGGSNTVSVLDLVYMRQDRTLQVGTQPSGLAVNPKRNEIYVVNAGTSSGNGSISVIDTTSNSVVATIPVHKLPSSIEVDDAGRRAYVANSGSNTVSVIDLDLRREVAVAGTGERPVLARISPDMRTLVVANRGSGSVSIFAVAPDVPESGLGLPGLVLKPRHSPADPTPHLRAAFSGCAGAGDVVILPYSTKVFVACSDRNQVMAIALAAAPSNSATQDASLLSDHMLAMLDVGAKPIQLALKHDGGEIFCSNFDSGTFSEINTTTNEVGGTYPIGSKPSFGIVDAGDGTLWVSNLGADSINLWSIDDGKNTFSVPTGHSPDALAFSADQHLLLAADTQSGDVTVIRTVDKNDLPALFTILPAGRAPNAIVVKPMQGKP